MWSTLFHTEQCNLKLSPSLLDTLIMPPPSPPSRTLPMELETVVATNTTTAALIPSELHSLHDTISSLILPDKQLLLRHLYRLLHLALRLFLHFTFLFLSPVLNILSSLLSTPTASLLSPPTSSSCDTPDVPVARALVHVLSLLCQVTTDSRKHELIRSLVERLLNDNFKFSSVLETVNRAALTEAFSQAVRLLEEKVEAEAPAEQLGVFARAVRYGMRRWSVTEEKKGGVAAEEVAGEMMWMAQKMVACGAGEAAVATWGGAESLGRLAVTAEPRVQVWLLRVSVFLFKYANKAITCGEEANIAVDRWGIMSMLRTWLPLLCRASNSVVTNVMGNSMDRGEMVTVLENMFEKLSWEEQEEVLTLWIQHFALCPDSDWPNLESCYSQWYTNSRELLLLE